MTTRRELLRRSAMAGAVVWAAPVITTLPRGVAWADHYRPVGACDGEATALRVFLGDDELLTFGHAEQPTDGEVCTVKIGRIDEHPDGSFTYEARSILGLFRLAAEVACGQVLHEDGTCHAVARVADLVIELGGRDDDEDDGGLSLGLGAAEHTPGDRHRKTVLRVQALRADAFGALTDRNQATWGESFLLKVTDANGRDLDVDSDCNFDVSILGLIRLIVDEQFCHDGQLTVRALRVLIPAARDPFDHAVLEVVAGEVKMRGAGDCHPCFS